MSAADQLHRVNLHSDHYQQLATGDGSTPIAQFGRRTLGWDASTTHAIALYIANAVCAEDDQRAMFADIVSYLVRRAVCGLTPKSYNKIFVQQLKLLAAGPATAEALRSSLAKLDGDASRWPRDEEFRKSWLESESYPGHLTAAQTKSILIELEVCMRSPRTEEPFLVAVETLDVDHVMPVSWFEHWPLPDGTHTDESEARESYFAAFSEQPLSDRHAAIRRRETAKARLDNLTLLHYGVNRGLQHYDFEKKRKALFANSNLQLNRELMMMPQWDESAIDRRGQIMFDVAKEVWKGP